MTVADDAVNGLTCSECGVFFYNDKGQAEAHGYPVLCRECWVEGGLQCATLSEEPINIDIKTKLKNAIDDLLQDDDVELIGFCEQAERGIVEHLPLTLMPTGEYSFILNFTRPSKEAAFKERKYG